MGIEINPAQLGFPAGGGQLSHGEQVRRSTEERGSETGGNSGVRKGEMAPMDCIFLGSGTWMQGIG